MKNKILKIWIDKGIIKNEVLEKNPTPLWETACDFAKSIAKMEGSDAEKLHFANEIKKIYP